MNVIELFTYEFRFLANGFALAKRLSELKALSTLIYLRDIVELILLTSDSKEPLRSSKATLCQEPISDIHLPLHIRF